MVWSLNNTSLANPASYFVISLVTKRQHYYYHQWCLTSEFLVMISLAKKWPGPQQR